MAEHCRLLISCEHGGNQLPAPYRSYFLGQEQRLYSHQGYDPGALGLARTLAGGLDVPLIKSETTRLLVDLNRSPGSRTLFSEITGKLNSKEKEQLLVLFYQPYRRRVREQINRNISYGAQVVHLSVHSFTPIRDGKQRNTDIGLLYDPAREPEKHFCHNWKQLLQTRMPDLKVRYNNPYRGTADGLVRTLRSCFSPLDYLGIELEVNQAQLADDKHFPPELQDCLLETLRELLPCD